MPNVTLVIESHSPTVTTSSGADGSYTLAFNSQRPFYGDTSIAGVVIARAGGYQSTTQAIPRGVSEFVQNIRLRIAPALTAGDAAVTVTVDGDSSNCFDGDSNWSFVTLCETVQIVTPLAGTLTITVTTNDVPMCQSRSQSPPHCSDAS